jgi:hypothetical protein
MGLQSHENPFPTWDSQDKMTFGCSARGQAQYYKGEDGGFPQV